MNKLDSITITTPEWKAYRKWTPLSDKLPIDPLALDKSQLLKHINTITGTTEQLIKAAKQHGLLKELEHRQVIILEKMPKDQQEFDNLPELHRLKELVRIAASSLPTVSVTSYDRHDRTVINNDHVSNDLKRKVEEAISIVTYLIKNGFELQSMSVRSATLRIKLVDKVKVVSVHSN